MTENKEEKLIEEIKTNIESIGINNLDNQQENNNNDKINGKIENRSRLTSYISTNSIDSKTNNILGESLQSMPFKEQLVLDLPNFTSTKYNSDIWKIINLILYSLFCLGLLADFILLNLKHYYIYPKSISDLCFFGYNFMNWFHYKRGCIGNANINSDVRTNIDKSFKAKLLRSEIGWKYFFSIIASFILIYSDIYYLVFSKKANEDYWNINLVGFMIISLAQILKIEKILTNNKQYSVMNDLPNCIIEISLFFSSLFFSTSFIIQMAYDYLKDSFQLLNFILNVIGILFLFISDISLLLRYFMSGYDDLNTSEISNLTERDV